MKNIAKHEKLIPKRCKILKNIRKKGGEKKRRKKGEKEGEKDGEKEGEI